MPDTQHHRGHAQLTRHLDPGDAATWSDIAICRGGHQLVYRLSDDAGQLLYVGSTWNPKERWKAHRKTKSWWPEVRLARVECHDTDLEAHEVEYEAIRTEFPRYNIHGAVR